MGYAREAPSLSSRCRRVTLHKARLTTRTVAGAVMKSGGYRGRVHMAG